MYQENTENWYYETKNKFDNGQTAVLLTMDLTMTTKINKTFGRCFLLP